MAKPNGRTLRGTPAEAPTFKGHPQPPPDERLAECKNYLADEDVNRNLNFKGRLTQIEDYVKDLEEKKLDCNKKLLRDVKTMAIVQREWMENFMDAPPCDKNGCNPTYVPHISRRLVSKEAGKELREEREAMGLGNQIREDHAPFTIERNEQMEFLERLKRDECENPETIDEKTNLLLVENRAYGWALREPSLIPVWLHPRLGLPNKGIRVTDKDPWYRQDRVLPAGSARMSRRPKPQKLPDYLQQAQDTINNLLNGYAKGISSEGDIARLEELLSAYELISLKSLRKDLDSMLQTHPETVKPKAVEEKIEHRRHEIKMAHRAWLSSFVEDGIQLMVGENLVTQILQPGVFYVPFGEPSTDHLSRLRRIEVRANALLQMTPEQLEDREDARKELASYLQTRWTPDMGRIVHELSEVPTPTTATADAKDLRLELEAKFSQAQIAFLAPFLNSKIQLRYQRPGEIAAPTPGLVYVPWFPDKQLPKPPATSLRRTEDLKKLENDINSVLQGMEVFPGKLKRRQEKALEKELEKVMFPRLRYLRERYLELKTLHRPKHNQEFLDAEFSYQKTCRLWVNSFLDVGLQIQITESSQLKERPEILYLREDISRLDDVQIGEKLRNLTRDISFYLQTKPQLQSNPEDATLYPSLANLQYPRLKRMDNAWRAMASKPNLTEAEIKAQQDAKGRWRKVYNSWVASFEKRKVVILLADDTSDLLGDPATVYYRGPLQWEDPDSPDSPSDRQDPPLSRRIVDRAFLLLTWYLDLAEDKVALATRMQAVSALPPSLTRKLREYNATLVDQASSTPSAAKNAFNDALAKKSALISAFSSWEKKIRDLARPVPTSTLEPELPPSIQEIENEVNQLLERGSLNSVEDQNRLEALITPFWHSHLVEFQNMRRSRLRNDGLSEEAIDLEDMSIGAFAAEFDYFKAKCRARGFRIREFSLGSFEAVEPAPQNYMLNRQQLEEHMFDSEWTTYAAPFLDSMGTNQVRESLYQRENDIINLLSIRRQVRGESETPEKNRYRTKKEEVKLIHLLELFFPARLSQAYSKLRGSSSPSASSSNLRADRNKVDAIKAFLDIYEPWIRRLASEETHLHLVIGSEDNVEDIEGGLLYLHRTNVPIVDEGWVHPHPLSSDFEEIETELSSLLISRAKTSLSMKDERRLRCLLSAVMPTGLLRRDMDLRIISQKARSREPSDEDVLQYIEESDRWKRDYYNWVDEITGSGVRLKKRGPEEPEPPRGSNIMFLRAENVDEIFDDSAHKNTLPLYILDKQTLLNRFLSGAADLTLEERDECQNYLYSLWKVSGDHVRQAWYNQLYGHYQIQPRSVLLPVSTRLQAAVEVQIRNSFSAFMKDIVGGPRTLHLGFVEIRPETFNVRLAPVNSDDAIQNRTMLQNKINNTMTIPPSFAPISDESLVNATSYEVPEILDRALKEFLPLAQKVRNLQDSTSAPALTDQERQQVEGLLQPLSRDTIKKMEMEITQLWQALKSAERLSKANQGRLKDLSMHQIWYMWGSMNPDIRDFTLESAGEPDPIGNLLNPMFPGAVQRDPPTVDPPTEDEILELEVTVDNLLDKAWDGTIIPLEDAQLKWLLRPLLPPGLRDLDNKIQELQWKSVGVEGLDATESLKLAEYRTQFSELFYTFIMRDMVSFETLLDRWWFNTRVIQQLYVHSRLWDSAIKETNARKFTKSSTQTDGQTASKTVELPGTSTQTTRSKLAIKNDTLRNRHDNHELLRQFTENFDGNYRDKLLLEHMDPPLKALYDEIQGLRDRTRSGRLDFDESLRLRIVTEDFVRDHMNWFSRLTPQQIQTFRGNTVDFSAKAERRGVQRAAVELGLNLLATNQEQHRPHDRFRRLRLPPKYQPPPEEVALWKALDSWKRPVELDPFHYTKLMQKFRRWKEYDYTKARNRVINENPGHLEPPTNYNGPLTLPNLHDMQETARKRHNHLGQIVSALLETNRKAPRPLLERMCMLTSEATAKPSGTQHPLQDDVQLTMGDLDLLAEICEPSWNNESRRWGPPGSTAGFPDSEPDFSAELAMLDEFARDVENATLEFPFWQPRLRAERQADQNSVEFFTQTKYSRNLSSATGITVEALQHDINTSRQARASARAAVHMWSEAEMRKYLQAMYHCGRIHFDAVTKLVSKIPPSGHPEHKYVLSEDDAQKASYIHFNKTTKKYDVQIDSAGNMGTPIVQPNKYEHFQQVAFRLGRDIRLLSEAIAVGDDEKTRYSKQVDALAKALQHMEEINPGHAANTVDPATEKELSLEMIARDILKYAPELRVDAGMDPNGDIATITTEEAAKIIQLQLIEESNNNWESRFPEDEHVWNWVHDPLSTTQLAADATTALTQQTRPIFAKQYFSLRRWPVECQSLAVQAMIKTSAPTIEPETDTTQTQLTEQVPALTAAERRRAAIGPYPRERYTGRGGPPNFPFGETPYQQAFQSFRMEEDLKDVEEFRRPTPPAGIINTLKRKLASPEPPPVDRFALPAIPTEWNPTNVSIQDKHLDIIEKAKMTEGLPDTDDAYFTPMQIAQMERDKARDHARNERKRAIAKMVEHTGKPYSQLTGVEIRDAQEKLNIDPMTEQIRPDPVTAKTAKKLGLGLPRNDGPGKSASIPGETLRGGGNARSSSSSGTGSVEMSGGLAMDDTAASSSDSGGSKPPGTPENPSGRTRSRSPKKRKASAPPIGRVPMPRRRKRAT